MKDLDMLKWKDKEHVCSLCTWRSFTNDGLQGCYKRQKQVNKPCNEYTEK